MQPITYIVKTQGAANFGGVELEYIEIVKFATNNGVKVVSATLDQILQVCKFGDRVYVQQEGRLSLEYRLWAIELLSRGAIILEKNVFALPSKFRPKHKNYYMIVMSKDGAFRYSIRGLLKANQQESLLVVPNLPFWLDPHSKDLSNKSSHRAAILRILRVGRPDPKKWSNIEIEAFQNIFGNLNSDLAKLTLVGAPDLIIEDAESRRMNIECLPYSKDVIQYYRSHNFYFLFSRIGETFGNTIFEALSAGMTVIYVFDLAWDCAPIEYLLNINGNDRGHIFELSKVSQISKNTFQPMKYTNLKEFNEQLKQSNLSLIFGEYSSLSIKRPSALQSLRYIYILGRNFQVSLGRICTAILIELFREMYLVKYIGKFR
jgi:glycosyltransferase involved in cell wall biosynthesis